MHAGTVHEICRRRLSAECSGTVALGVFHGSNPHYDGNKVDVENNNDEDLSGPSEGGEDLGNRRRRRRRDGLVGKGCWVSSHAHCVKFF